MINTIVDSAPKKFRKRALFMMESNLFWLIGSASSYLWLGYPAMRFLWRISKADIVQWKIDIKKTFSAYYNLYKIMVTFFNISVVGYVVFIIYYFFVIK